MRPQLRGLVPHSIEVGAGDGVGRLHGIECSNEEVHHGNALLQLGCSMNALVNAPARGFSGGPRFALIFFIGGPPVGVDYPLWRGREPRPAFARHPRLGRPLHPHPAPHSGDVPARRHRGRQGAWAWRRGEYRRPCQASMSTGGCGSAASLRAGLTTERDFSGSGWGPCGSRPAPSPGPDSAGSGRRRAEIRRRRAQVPVTPALTD
jgi:hypothetical protein